MSDPAQGLARLLAAAAAGQRQRDRQPFSTRMSTGTVVAWDSDDGYVVNVAGAPLSGLLVLGGGVSFTPGDVVVLLQYKSSVLVLGKAAAAGS
jgi:hypothetical protein